MQGSLARKLRVLRAERGLTLRQAAEQAGVRPGTLSELERGLHRPHDITLSRVAKGYGVPVEELLEEPVPLAEAPDTGRVAEERRELERYYESLRDRLANIDELGRHEQRALFDESSHLYKDLLLSQLNDAPTDSERREQDLVLDVLEQAIHRLLAIWKLRQDEEVGDQDLGDEEVVAKIASLEEYKEYKALRARRKASA